MTSKMGNIPHNKLPDTIAACNMIRSERILSRMRNKKSIRMDFDNDEKIYIDLFLKVNLSTGTVSLAHSLRYHGLAFYPTTNQKLRCTNQHALDVLYHARDHKKEYERNKKKGNRL